MEVTKWWKKYVGVGNDLLYDPSDQRNNALWDELQQATAGGTGLSLQGIEGGGHMPALSTQDPYESDLETQLEIQRKRSTGFNTFFISPSQLNASDYACQLEMSKIFNIFGYDGENTSYNNPAVAKNAWRSFAIPSSGNFLKIDWAPSRGNFIVPRFGMTNPTTNSQNFTPSEWSAAGLNIVPASNANNTGDLQAVNNVKPFESNPIFLIQLENSSAPPLVVRAGEKIKAPFSTIIITFKAGCPRFMVTTGFNTDIISEADSRVMNANLAMGPGNGLWNHPKRHPQPFAFSTSVQQNAPGGGVGPVLGNAASVGPLNIAAGNSATFTLFQVPGFNSGSTTRDQAGTNVPLSISGGVGVGWITNIGVQASSSANVATFARYGWILYVSSAVNNVLIDQGTVVATSVSNQLQTFQPMERNFATPKRFILRNGEKLLLFINSFDVQITIAAQVHGYVFGDVVQSDNILTTTNTGWCMQPLTEPCFPQDFARQLFWT